MGNESANLLDRTIIFLESMQVSMYHKFKLISGFKKYIICLYLHFQRIKIDLFCDGYTSFGHDFSILVQCSVVPLAILVQLCLKLHTQLSVLKDAVNVQKYVT